MTKAAELTFPFNIHLGNYHALGITNELTEAAQCGDLGPLHRLQSEFGGVSYNYDVAVAALKSGQFQFWCQYVLLARWVCIVIESGPIGPWIEHLLPISHILAAKIDDRLKFEAFKFAIEEYLPNLPSREEFKTGDQDLFYYDHRIILPPHRYSIWCLDNFREFPKTSDGDAIINRIMRSGNRDMIDLLIKKGIKFSLKHLQTIGFKYRPDLYDLVLNNLRPHIDRDHIPISCQYPNSPNDAELLSMIASAAEDDQYREVDSLNDITEFLHHNPQFIPKLPAIVEFFQNVLDGHDVTEQRRDDIADWFYYFLSASEVRSRVPKALQISQILGNRFQNEINVNEKAPLDFPGMSRYDRMLLHLRERNRGIKNYEDIPEHERVIDDEYPRYPEHDHHDDYAAWVKVVGHGYLEDFLGGSDHENSGSDQEEGEYSHDWENGDHYNDEDVDGEGVQYSGDEDHGDDIDEVRCVEYSGDDANGDYEPECSEVEKRNVDCVIDGNGSTSLNDDKHEDLQCAENSESLAADRADNHSINDNQGH